MNVGYRKSGTRDPGPLGGTLGWDPRVGPKVGPLGGTLTEGFFRISIISYEGFIFHGKWYSKIFSHPVRLEKT